MIKRYDTHTSTCLSGTGDWIFQQGAVQNWRNGSVTPSVVWMYGRPGSGKSVLSAHLIQELKKVETDIPVAFCFYRFDEEITALDVLRLLSLQLFEKHWSKQCHVPEELFQKANSILNSSITDIVEFVRLLVRPLSKVYIVIDGVDEEWALPRRRTEAAVVLLFLVQLSKENPSVRLWYSSQYREDLKTTLGAFSSFDIQDSIEQDVKEFVKQNLDALEVSESLKATAIEDISTRAEGHFLWASLMVSSLKNATSARQVKDNLAKVPSDITTYYSAIFHRYEQDHLSLVRYVHRLILWNHVLPVLIGPFSKMFSLVLFAHRPLRLRELRDALGILECPNPSLLQQDDLPFISLMRSLCRPLIEIQEIDYEESHDTDDGICHIFHSTLHNFLINNPDILSNRSGIQNLRIGPEHMFEACVRYLRQERYRTPLSKENELWVDKTGSSIDTQYFLIYAAKYWHRHVESVEETKPRRETVERFLKSSNFLTCIQIQALWVESHFHLWRTEHTEPKLFFRRIFPSWFAHSGLQLPHSQSDSSLWEDFRTFIHEWQYFLQCWLCARPECSTLAYAGQIDRCLLGAFGPKNFMSKFPGRYRCFTFQDKKQITPHTGQCYEGISPSGSEVRILRLL